MAEYRIEQVEKGDIPHKLALLKDGREIAAVQFSGGFIHLINGAPDREFVARYGRPPGVELLMHVAHHNQQPNGTALLTFIGLSKTARTTMNRLIKTSEVEEENGKYSGGIRIKKIEPKIPPIKLE